MTSYQAQLDGPAIAPIQWRRLAAAMPGPAVWLFAVAIAIASYSMLPDGGLDWRDDIAPAARSWWPAPWSEGLPLLPWAAMLLSPLGALPVRLGTALVNGASVVALGAAVRGLGGRDWMAIPLLLTPLGYGMFSNGQTDTLILSGLLLTNGADLLIVALKPQVAIGIVVARLRRAGSAWPAYLAPIVIAVGVSLLVWPAWPVELIKFAPILVPTSWNWSAWPWGLVLAAGLLWRAWRTGDDRLGVAASPFLFPYVNGPSYLGLLAALAARWPRAVLAAWGLFWAVSIWILLSALATPAAVALYTAVASVAVAVGVAIGLRRRRAS